MHSQGNHQQNEKTTHGMGENIQKHTSDKGLTFRIYQEILQLNHNQNNSIQMLAKDLNRHFSKDTIQMAGLTGDCLLYTSDAADDTCVV